MHLKIFQLYFQQDQIQFLDPAFTPFDNTKNLQPLLREYPLLLQCRDLAKKDNVEYWGATSWKWMANFGVSPAEFISHIQRNEGYDVYTIDPWPHLSTVVYNQWEQGQWCHPHIVEVMEHMFPLMGVDKDILYQPTDRTTLVWGHNAVCSRIFWDRYFEFTERYVSNIKNLPPRIRELHDGHANYGYDSKVESNLTYFPFIQERLFSTFLLLHRHKLKILPYKVNEERHPDALHMLNALKGIAIERKDPAILSKWRNRRGPSLTPLYPDPKIDWAEKWIPKFNLRY